MPKSDAPRSILQANIARLIGNESVNSWAVRHKLQQTTVNRILMGQDAKMSTVETIAEALKLKPWQLLHENLVADAETRAQPVAKPAADLSKRLAEIEEAISRLRKETRGESLFGELGDDSKELDAGHG